MLFSKYSNPFFNNQTVTGKLINFLDLTWIKIFELFCLDIYICVCVYMCVCVCVCVCITQPESNENENAIFQGV